MTAPRSSSPVPGPGWAHCRPDLKDGLGGQTHHEFEATAAAPRRCLWRPRGVRLGRPPAAQGRGAQLNITCPWDRRHTDSTLASPGNLCHPDPLARTALHLPVEREKPRLSIRTREVFGDDDRMAGSGGGRPPA